jgi:hypothetical protein
MILSAQAAPPECKPDLHRIARANNHAASGGARSSEKALAEQAAASEDQ